MSERKRLRLARCIMCLQKKYIVKHRKCHDCRVQLQMSRYADKNKLHKFRKPSKQNKE